MAAVRRGRFVLSSVLACSSEAAISCRGMAKRRRRGRLGGRDFSFFFQGNKTRVAIPFFRVPESVSLFSVCFFFVFKLMHSFAFVFCTAFFFFDPGASGATST